MRAIDLIMVSYDADRDRAIVRTVVVAAAAGAVGGALLYATARRRHLRVPKSGPFPADSLPADAFDAIIVGGGPSGSTCGYYLAKAGAKASRSTLADLKGPASDHCKACQFCKFCCCCLGWDAQRNDNRVA